MQPTEFTLTDLVEIMRSCAGVDEGVDLDGDIGDTPFAELGYDSLAVLAFQARIQERTGVPMPDDTVAHMPTPNAAVDFVNQQIRAGVR
ncbi:act minimal PKS acyl carrier protein [Streptoalloteichus tenebrarius]|uniref:Act minimal PKS acyl carrier protein n=1 Tax=Streptoalloteichus tenebrarius (strain ATCC 17920 / DSM 40477 / JCM 4838 / CBS 697.72 / NBRC 16177 / NCIMB 11028 / NRRL B-12390 / A12253. 1 / ISP 5477) TaxID=1933 RepID=A0ABT1HX07_STRSD|nr:acyl carrier protein [Streptoalloteichus tenebrarius]MCP2260056.1 act minimal PKS acyl carrier protein [Streptoalloteichus tenebrarius]BFF03822.1 acyl carrier protein [Streptoalloteichus tenebrarius]